MANQDMFVGIHVTQGSLEVAVRPEGSTWRLQNDEAGLRDLIARLRKLNLKIVLLAAEGELELPVVAELAIAALPVAMVAPGKLGRYARRTDHRVETDGLAPWILARYAEEQKPDVHPFKYTHVLQLERLTTRRQQLNSILGEERQAFAQASGELRSRIRKHIKRLEDDLKLVARDLEKVITRSPVWPKPFACIRNWTRRQLAPVPRGRLASTISLLIGLILLGAAVGVYTQGNDQDKDASTESPTVAKGQNSQLAGGVQLTKFLASLGGIALGGGVSVALGGILPGSGNPKRYLWFCMVVGLVGVLVATTPGLHDRDMLRVLEPYAATASALAGSALGVFLGLLPQEPI